ncbi:single-stranded DNA-binding protein [Puerhibacterium sp. TATVAM-FAB25]|uniref:single-stranded DNA-binding protein n=1 Tax=Puerhibacterium sp. TATVAM-FAB25 TaxID=3093699 RepID=UPI00397A1E1E
MSDVNVTVTGHVGNEPVISFSASGTPWTSFRVASTRRVRDPRTGEWADGPTLWFTVKAFGDRAFNVAQSLAKGTPVIVTGRLGVDEYEVRRAVPAPDGGPAVEATERRTALLVDNAAVALDVSRGVATYTRVVHRDTVPGGAGEPALQPGRQGAPGGGADPWATAPGADVPAGREGDAEDGDADDEPDDEEAAAPRGATAEAAVPA